ncbi:alpha-amylase [Streptomyces sp. B1I3]|uniref:alpha-amylase n=1 Tax=Streptomyces sp. B1I3 TaxID=3042264 RepID=UPI0027D797CA|nr:alpha-amylase [Streptomyces sp. B1I3]
MTTVVICFSQVAGASAAAQEDLLPPCVQYSTSWRYTFVTNSCDATQYVTVEYRDGSTVPCRTAGPGDTVTFPGNGTMDNGVRAVILCAAGSQASPAARAV